MPLEIPPLPCDPLSFAPQFSVEGVDLHRRQQQAQFDAIRAIVGEADAADLRLEDLARRARGALAAHAAQAWCEGFYWEAMRAPRPEGDNAPGGPLAEAIAGAFGDAKRLRERFKEVAQRLAGPGWVWLAQRRDGRLAILATPQSVAPLTGSDTPLLACCLWPHAYAHDYGDSRERYLAAFWQLVDWDKVASRLQ